MVHQTIYLQRQCRFLTTPTKVTSHESKVQIVSFCVHCSATQPAIMTRTKIHTATMSCHEPSVIYALHLAVPHASISLTCLSATLALQIHHCATFTQRQSVLLCVTRLNSVLTSSTLPTLLGVPSCYTQRLISSSSKLLLLI